ncbi:MAG: hypothetical protein IT383_02025 [Deltaproteobacteria bacterium]|nr:hypothetical protein [Deltaproteobacteria bacterium]
MKTPTPAPSCAGPLLLTALAAACLHEVAPAPCALDVAGADSCVGGGDATGEEEGARALSAGSSLRFISISEGGSYADPVAIQAEAPSGTAYVVYSSGGAVLAVATERSSAWVATVRFGTPGARVVVARAFDSDDGQLGEVQARITVGDPATAPSLRFLSPAAEGGHYLNGIWFKTAATGPISHVRYSADAYDLGDSAEPDFQLHYTFRQVGERRVLAEGLAADGAVLARAERVIVVVDPNAPPTTRAGRARAVLREHEAGTLVLWDQQFGNRDDGADAWRNLRDTANGGAARRSVHGTAPGGTVLLSSAMLDGMLALEQRGFRFFVTSVAGGSHSWGSLHYSGRAFDADEVNGVLIRGDSALARSFMNACVDEGATEVFGPSNDPSGHWDHVHCAW